MFFAAYLSKMRVGGSAMVVVIFCTAQLAQILKSIGL